MTGGGLAFEGRFKFESTQGGMITGFFPYEQFPEGAVRDPYDELDFEILTTGLKKISTNVYTTAGSDHPQSIPMVGSFSDWHVYRIEWLPGEVSWFVDGTLISTDTQDVPTTASPTRPFLAGDGATSFKAELTSADSAFHNTLGTYTIAADGTISDVHVLFADTLNTANAGRSVDLVTPEHGSTVGFFLIQGGLDAYGQLPDDLSFIAPQAGGLPTVLHSASRGDLVNASSFHSIAALNPADMVQVLSGAAPGGEQLLIGFEDVSTAIGDNDFQDVVLKISALRDDDFLLT